LRDGTQERHVAPFRAGPIWGDLATGVVSVRVDSPRRRSNAPRTTQFAESARRRSIPTCAGISIIAEAFAAIAATLPLGSTAFEPEIDGKG
jgi:hypothetical protein